MFQIYKHFLIVKVEFVCKLTDVLGILPQVSHNTLPDIWPNAADCTGVTTWGWLATFFWTHTFSF